MCHVSVKFLCVNIKCSINFLTLCFYILIVCQLIDICDLGRKCVQDLFDHFLATISHCLDSYCQEVWNLSVFCQSGFLSTFLVHEILICLIKSGRFSNTFNYNIVLTFLMKNTQRINFFSLY